MTYYIKEMCDKQGLLLFSQLLVFSHSSIMSIMYGVLN